MDQYECCPQNESGEAAGRPGWGCPENSGQLTCCRCGFGRRRPYRERGCRGRHVGIGSHETHAGRRRSADAGGKPSGPQDPRVCWALARAPSTLGIDTESASLIASVLTEAGRDIDALQSDGPVRNGQTCSVVSHSPLGPVRGHRKQSVDAQSGASIPWLSRLKALIAASGLEFRHSATHRTYCVSLALRSPVGVSHGSVATLRSRRGTRHFQSRHSAVRPSVTLALALAEEIGHGRTSMAAIKRDWALPLDSGR